jgi:hypothetical protein
MLALQTDLPLVSFRTIRREENIKNVVLTGWIDPILESLFEQTEQPLKSPTFDSNVGRHSAPR